METMQEDKVICFLKGMSPKVTPRAIPKAINVIGTNILMVSTRLFRANHSPLVYIARKVLFISN
jgi:hypothetical protein